MLRRPRKLDGAERARLMRAAVEAVAGEVPEGIEVRVHGEDAEVADADGFGFRVGNAQVLQRGERPFLEVALEAAVDGLCRLPPLWGRRLPLCPEHPDAHRLRIELGDGTIVGICPTLGAVRTVRY